MRNTSTILARIALAAALAATLVPLAHAQAPTGKGPKPQTAPTQPAESRRAVATKPDTSSEQAVEVTDPETKAALDQLRRELEREALNRMRYGRPDRFRSILSDLGPFLVFAVFLVAVLWVLRVVLDNRRWYRVVRVQTDMHTKLLDKFASSQEMLAYMESEAGKKFLESPAFDIQPKQSAAFPYARILWSAQVGLIVGVLGIGLLMLRGHIPNASYDSTAGVMQASSDADAALLVFGTIALTLGIGFLLSAVVSYILSKRLGLLEGVKPSTSGPEPTITRG